MSPNEGRRLHFRGRNSNYVTLYELWYTVAVYIGLYTRGRFETVVFEKIGRIFPFCSSVVRGVISSPLLILRE